MKGLFASLLLFSLCFPVHAESPDHPFCDFFLTMPKDADIDVIAKQLGLEPIRVVDGMMIYKDRSRLYRAGDHYVQLGYRLIDGVKRSNGDYIVHKTKPVCMHWAMTDQWIESVHAGNWREPQPNSR